MRFRFREPEAGKPRVVMAYSGGLDTSCQLKWLTKEKGYEVCAYIADLGQDDVLTDEMVEAIRDKAETSGAYAFYCEDVKKEFVTDFVFKMLKTSCLYEGRYLMGTSIARPCIAKRQIEICWEEGAEYVTHGSTGKGNDQVRFELCYLGMDPNIIPVTPWREPEYFERFPGRPDLLDYATANEIPVGATKKHSYSEDENLLHISYESGELEDPAYPGHGQEYPGMVLKKKSVDIMDTPDTPCNLTIGFKNGEPVSVKNVDDGTEITDPLELFLYLNKVGGEHGVGRLDLIENRFVGMKSRGCYETPGGTILFHAHQDLELLCVDREVMRVRDTLNVKYSELLYNGFWFSPEMEFIRAAQDKAQEHVEGEAYIRLHKGNVMCLGRSSPRSLYNEDLVSMDKHGGFNPVNSTGFINTLATRLKASKARDLANN